MSWEKARAKIQQGKSYQDTVPVPFGDPETGEVETISLTHELLDEDQYWDVAQSIDASALEGDNELDDDVEEARQRVQELQSKEERSPAEEEELEEKMEVVSRNQGQLMTSLGEETFTALMGVGKTTLVPSEEDIENAFELDAHTQEQRFNFIPNTRDEMREALKLEMEEMVEGQPYPIKFIVGMKAWSETQSVLGETELNDTNPNTTA